MVIQCDRSFHFSHCAVLKNIQPFPSFTKRTVFELWFIRISIKHEEWWSARRTRVSQSRHAWTCATPPYRNQLHYCLHTSEHLPTCDDQFCGSQTEQWSLVEEWGRARGEISVLEPKRDTKTSHTCEAYLHFYSIKRLWYCHSSAWSARLPCCHYFTTVLNWICIVLIITNNLCC